LFAAKAVSQGILMKTRIDVTLPVARPHVAEIRPTVATLHSPHFALPQAVRPNAARR